MHITRIMLIPSLIGSLLSMSVVAQTPATQQQPQPETTQTADQTPAAKATAAPVTIGGITVTPIGDDLEATNQPANAPAQQADAPPVRINRLGQTVLSPRISSITRVGNSMPHMLTGVGLVTGLAGTGSSDRGTRQALLNYIKQHDLNLTLNDVTNSSTALVALTCELPPFAKVGMTLDVKAEVVGDAISLRGGELMLAELKGVDGKAYVAVQGPIIVAGFADGGKNASVKVNPSASGHILNRARVIREENTSFFSESGALELHLLNPTPFNSSSVAAGISTALAGMHISVAAVDPSLVRLELPDQTRTNEYAMRILGLIGNVRVAVENPTKVTIDQVSGTVLAGEGVLISPCVVGLSELTISIVEEDYISQPNAFAQGQTAGTSRTRVETNETSTELQPIGGGGATVSDLLQNLKALGLRPSQLVAVFTALDQGGFLHATLEVR